MPEVQAIVTKAITKQYQAFLTTLVRDAFDCSIRDCYAQQVGQLWFYGMYDSKDYTMAHEILILLFNKTKG